MKKEISIIVIAQFLCTSVWFAGNAVLGDITQSLNVPDSFLANLTSSVQFGFIFGTLVFAILSIADRFSPSKVFFVCALIAAVFNLGIISDYLSANLLLSLRFATGFFLAGIYPVGMKIASDYEDKGLGKSLGYLVGALVLGTAFPHFLKSISADFSWKYVIIGTSTLSFIGGLLILILVPDGPFLRKSSRLKWSALFSGFKHKSFRSAAFGYFGHMWELYTFWAFVPIILTQYKNEFPVSQLHISIWSFIIIASGTLSCIIGGFFSEKLGPKKVAFSALALSGFCCVLSPFLLVNPSQMVFLSFLILWGMLVVADSPMFSTLVAQHAPAHIKGTAITIVNCIGFSITILSIQFLKSLEGIISFQFIFMFLAVGPFVGLLNLLLSKENLAHKKSA